MRSLSIFLLFLLTAGCDGGGADEKTPCDQLTDIWQEICALPEEYSHPCFPCSCALCGKGWDIPMQENFPDIANASCSGPLNCTGQTPSFVETCLEHAPTDPFDPPLPQGWIENECDPRYSYGTWLCDNAGNYNMAFPELIALGASTYDCGEQ